MCVLRNDRSRSLERFIFLFFPRGESPARKELPILPTDAVPLHFDKNAE